MSNLENDKIQCARVMEVWARDQDSDHHRQTRIASFILSLAQIANDLMRLRNAHLISYGDGNTAQGMSEIGFRNRHVMDKLEFLIRQHSVRTFGEDIFRPGDPRSVRALPTPESSQLG